MCRVRLVFSLTPMSEGLMLTRGFEGGNHYRIGSRALKPDEARVTGDVSVVTVCSALRAAACAGGPESGGLADYHG